VLTCGIMGKDNARLLCRRLDQERIPHDFLRVPGKVRSNFTFVDAKTGKLRRVVEPSVKVRNKDIKRFLVKYSRIISIARAVVISGRALPQKEHLAKRLIQIARRKNVPCVLDATGLALKKGMIAKPWMIKPNLEETQAYLGQRLGTRAKVVGAAFCLAKRGCSIAAISLGQNGAVVCDGDRVYYGMSPRVRVISALGCGDAFVAGFVASYIEEGDTALALRQALACGAQNAEELQPGRIRVGRMRRLRKRMRVRVI